VACGNADATVAGYYSLAAGSVEPAAAASRISKGLPRHAVPVMLLAADTEFVLGMVKKPAIEQLVREKAAAVLGRAVQVRFVLKTQLGSSGADQLDVYLGLLEPSPVDIQKHFRVKI
jgi:hypothetical protein